MAAGFQLFDAGLNLVLIQDAAVGSSLDRTGALGVKLWAHHFGQMTTIDDVLNASATHL